MDGSSRRDAEAMVGRTLGEFVVRELLSAGGFGLVFRAEQPALAREAVIKVLQTRHRGRDTVVQRFLREAQLASKLDHPYAAHTYAFGAESDGILWIAMELVRGTPLDKLLEAHGPLPLERFVPLLERICEVIHTAHEQGIVHRDLKPANVMVLSRAGRLLPKLLDLGIAKLAGAPAADAPAVALAETVPEDAPADPSGRLTEEGAVMGSPAYMAPEQWMDAGTVDARTDQYALGVLCYEALTGRPPFAGTSRMSIAMAHARQAPPSLGADFPPALDAVIGRALAKDAADRYPGVLELAAAFRAASGVAQEPVTLPRLPDALRAAVLAGAPQPLAHAVAALDAARNAHQARDALWQVLRVGVRLLGVTALASHAQVGAAHTTGESGIGQALRGLRRRTLGDDEWLALARELCQPFASLRDAHPVPELVDLVCGGGRALQALLALRAAADDTASDEAVRELLVKGVPLAAAALEELAFLADYPLVVPGDPLAEVWMGGRRGERPPLRLTGKPAPAGQPVLVDAAGVPVVALWPFVQVLAPAPGAAEHVFFFEGKGRRGARLVALPAAFERDDEALWEALGGLVDDSADGARRPSVEERCPFPGLAAFTREDAGSFFGRERETEAFVNRLRVEPLLAVVGPSGAGKSSFVQAGVLPALPAGWHAVTVRPGPSPLASLSARRIGSGVDSAIARAELRDHPGALGSILRARTGVRGGTLVLVVDQLEELFTLCDDPEERALYAEALVRAARSPDDPIRVVLTLRDDFLLHAEALPAFRSRLQQGLQLLTTPAPAELRRILVEPIARAGYELDDPTLADDMVAEIAAAPGALALLSFTASKLWERRDRRFRQLGRKAYASLGGVGGALAHHAEATLEAMPFDEQRLVREVFRHLVTAEGTRAVMSPDELDQVLGGGAHAAAVVAKLVAARLLVSAESEDGGKRVEITHEALLGAWPRLVGWRREDAEGARLRGQLRAAARQWEERGRASGLLWRGDALAEYRLWRARHGGAMTASEEAFAAASLADAARGRRTRTLLVAGAFVALGAVVVALVILNDRANDDRRAAQASRQAVQQSALELRSNLQRQFENQGRRLVLDGDPLQALAYLAKAAELGASGRAHDFLVAEAVEQTDGELFEVRHDGAIRSPHFSHDGTRLVTAGLDGSAMVWDARTGAALLTLGHDGIVARASFAPDDGSVLTGSFDGTAVLWDARTGAKLHTLRHGAPLLCAAFSGDGALVVTGGDDGGVVVWDRATGERRWAAGGLAMVTACAFSPDSRWLAVGDAAGATALWDAHTGVDAGRIGHARKRIRTLQFDPDGRALLTASEDGTAAEWAIPSGVARHVFSHDGAVMSAAYSADGALVVTGSADRTAAIWDVATGQRVLVLRGHEATVRRALFSPDRLHVATVSEDGTARLWDARDGREVARWIGHQNMILDEALDDRGDRLVTAGEDGVAIVWSTAPQERTRWLSGHRGEVYAAAFSHDGALVATGGEDGTVRLWNAWSGESSRVLVSQHEPVSDVAFARDDRQLAFGTHDGTVTLVDTSSGAARELANGLGYVRQLAFSPDGTMLAAATDGGWIDVWTVSTAAPAWSHKAPDPVTSVVFSADGASVVTTGRDGATRWWAAVGGAEQRHLDDPGTAASVSFSPDGDRAVSVMASQAAKVWRVQTGETLFLLLGHRGAVFNAVWSPTEDLIVTVGADGTQRTWDPSTGDVLGVRAQGRQVWAAAFSPDGRRVVSAADDGSVAIWELPRVVDTATLERVMQCRVPYTFTGDRPVQSDRQCP